MMSFSPSDQNCCFVKAQNRQNSCSVTWISTLESEKVRVKYLLTTEAYCEHVHLHASWQEIYAHFYVARRIQLSSTICFFVKAVLRFSSSWQIDTKSVIS